jgi:hypothetical protein
MAGEDEEHVDAGKPALETRQFYTRDRETGRRASADLSMSG